MFDIRDSRVMSMRKNVGSRWIMTATPQSKGWPPDRRLNPTVGTVTAVPCKAKAPRGPDHGLAIR